MFSADVCLVKTKGGFQYGGTEQQACNKMSAKSRNLWDDLEHKVSKGE